MTWTTSFPVIWVWYMAYCLVSLLNCVYDPVILKFQVILPPAPLSLSLVIFLSLVLSSLVNLAYLLLVRPTADHCRSTPLFLHLLLHSSSSPISSFSSLSWYHGYGVMPPTKWKVFLILLQFSPYNIYIYN